MDSSALPEAQRRIEQAHESGATFLDLSFLNLDDEQLAILAPRIAQLSNLTTLLLGYAATGRRLRNSATPGVACRGASTVLRVRSRSCARGEASAEMASTA